MSEQKTDLSKMPPDARRLWEARDTIRASRLRSVLRAIHDALPDHMQELRDLAEKALRETGNAHDLP